MQDNYYDKHGQEFALATRDAQVSALYQPFLKFVKPGAYILDAGCGSGRDLKFFADSGYKVIGIDSAPEMVRLAEEYSEQVVQLLAFQEIQFRDEFDGIWACASLLHVPEDEFGGVLTRLAQALKVGAVLYMSFKYGTAEGIRNGRFFNDFTEDKLSRHLAEHRDLELVNLWLTNDVRPGRSSEQWLNAIVRRIQQDTPGCQDISS